ncbi:MAG: hypothetical protein EP343_17285 [Deltaproteobacteria bacterium]|nr:MAG: hypothetical protein EP343_17285 [Deltaproteobacteria bacterium]
MKRMFVVCLGMLILGSACSDTDTCGRISLRTRYKIYAFVGKTYQGSIQLPDGSQSSYTLKLEEDPRTVQGYEVQGYWPRQNVQKTSDSSFSTTRLAYIEGVCDPSNPSVFPLKGVFTHESKSHPRIDFTGLFHIRGGIYTLLLKSVENQEGPDSPPKYRFVIQLDEDFAFTQGESFDYSKGTSDSQAQKGKFITFTK